MGVKGSKLYLMYLPALFLFLLFVFYPLFSGLHISLTEWNGFSQHSTFVGMDNYVHLLTDYRIRTSLVNTLTYGIGSTIIQNLWGLLYALLLNRMFFGRNVVRAVVYLPVMVSGLIMGYIWYFVVQYDQGALNDILLLFGATPVDWLANGTRGVQLITFITSFQFVGQAMIIYLAGLQTIPRTFYEAAEIDGSSGWAKFFHITLPLLKPAIITTVILKLIGGLQLFDLIVALTNGGPGFSTHSFSTLINFFYFENRNAGYASALGVVLFIFILIVTLRFLHRKEVDYE